MKKRLEAPDDVQAEFKAWCSPIRGLANPEIQTNVVWNWLVKTNAWPHSAHEAAGHGEKASPGWCFSRYGQSETLLPDGSILYIGGEHEDYYDPDFYIYNDVIVVRPGDSIEIFGYPVDVFPPTDSHSATLVGKCVYIIGSLGYPDDRDSTNTSVYRLNLADWSIEAVTARGTAPPCLFAHDAEYCEQSQTIICAGGEIAHDEAGSFVENITTWTFDVQTSAWAQSATKPYTRWLLVREDNNSNTLWEYGRVVDAIRAGKRRKFTDGDRAKLEELGIEVDVDLFEQRFVPPIEHTPVANDPGKDSYRTSRINLNGTIIRFEQGRWEIAVTCEGPVSEENIGILKQHGLETFSKLEASPYKCIPL